ATQPYAARLAVLGDPALLAARAKLLGVETNLVTRNDPASVGPHRPGSLQVLPLALRAPVTAGRPDTANAAYVLEMLRTGTELCRAGTAAAIVTAPVQKSVITNSGVAFSGHTEFLAELTGAPLPVMLLAGKTLRVALATTHLPLRDVPDALSIELLENIVRITATDLQRRFRIAHPRILVL